MRAVVVYESMFGNTRAVAEAIADGLRPSADVVQVVPVADAGASALESADLVVAGGPTHAWGMSRANTRKSAPGYANKPGSGLVLEPGADTGPGIREWLASAGRLQGKAVAFDTKIKGPAALTGRASRAIARGLRSAGADLVLPPESFLVDRKSHLLPGETDRARSWGERLASTVAAGAAGPPSR